MEMPAIHENSYNEYAIFVDFLVTINEKHIKIPFKLKIDNFYIANRL